MTVDGGDSRGEWPQLPNDTVAVKAVMLRSQALIAVGLIEDKVRTMHAASNLLQTTAEEKELMIYRIAALEHVVRAINEGLGRATTG
jgi:hypothetical protein